MSWFTVVRSRIAGSAPRTSPTRIKLLVLLPFTMGLLVAATGFFAVSTSNRIHTVYGASVEQTNRHLQQLDIQLMLVAVIAAVLGLGIAFGVTMPLRVFADRLEALASGDLRGSLSVGSTSDVEWLAGAFNDAMNSMNRYVFQIMTGAVITLTAEGRIISSSPAAELVLGYREEELVGRRFSEAFAPADTGRAPLAAIEAAITTRKPVPFDETFIATKDGRRVRVGLSVSYLRQTDFPASDDDTPDPAGEVIGVTIGFKDAGEVRHLRESLRKADQLMALGTVTAGVAHELRNPLASMRGLAELLGRDFAQDDRRRQYVSSMITAIDRLNLLVENLLLLSSDPGLADESVEIDVLVREVVSFVTLGLGEAHVELMVEPEAGVGPLWVRCNRNRLIQAVSNIVLNAVQATPAGGRVSVRAERLDQAVSIRVHNTGSYIPPDAMKRLFVPFFTTRPNGTGLGLAIARHIVGAGQGRIEVESEPATGTSFTIRFPAAGPRVTPTPVTGGSGSTLTRTA